MSEAREVTRLAMEELEGFFEAAERAVWEGEKWGEEEELELE